MTSRFLTAEQLAEHMQISVETVWRYTREGKIPALRVGNHYRYDADEVIRALSSAGREVSTRGARDEEPNVEKKQQQPDLSISGQRRMTYEEFGKLPEQAGLQLIDGFLVKEPSPRYGHQAIIGELYLQMALHVNRWRLGKVILAPFDVVLADDQVLQPDIMFVTKERMHLIKENGLFGAPDLALEVLSPASRHFDTGRKRELYLQHGCLELWIIDPDKLTVTQSVRNEGRWEENTLTRDDFLVSVAIEGFSLRVSEIAPR